MSSQADSTYPIYVLDVFTEKRFGGNPAAVVLLPKEGHGWFSDDTLSQIAAENNLPATAFVLPVDDADVSSQPSYELRWFTPKREIILCGHATLASSYVVATVLKTDAQTITFRTRRSGTLTAKVLRGEDASSLQIELSFPALVPDVEVKDPELINLANEAVGCQVESLRYSSADLSRNRVAVLRSADAVKSVRPDLGKVAKVTAGGVGLIVTAAVSESDSDAYRGVDFVSRFFAPNAGIDEDPVTGSAHCVTTPYWAAKLGKKELHARQISARVGDLLVAHDGGDRVLLRGSASLYLEGRINVP